jgi:hypothetical protein
MKEQEVVKMELLITLNENIVIQRFFNVKNYNPQVRQSFSVAEYISNFCYDFAYDLKMKTVVYMLENRQQIDEDPSVLQTSMTDGDEYFNIYLKIGDMTICHRQMDAKLYPPKVRYTVDIRPQIKNVLKDLTDIFSSENISLEYMNLGLVG